MISLSKREWNTMRFRFAALRRDETIMTPQQEISIPETARTVTFSLPPEMAERLDNAAQQQKRSKSEFLIEAVNRYIEECEWRQILQYGEEKARELGIGPEDVARLVDECRAEVEQSKG